MIKAIKGTKDILPGESFAWQELERSARRVFANFGYLEIRTPVIEETALFIKTIGEDTDIVSKEMFSFVDRGDRNISLRPEGTAPVVRAYIENNLDKLSQLQKLYYIAPMFRAERPQAGRLRQFHQMGVEAIGSSHSALDAEVIRVLCGVLDSAGIKDYKLKLNNLGCKDDKKKLSDALRYAFSDKKEALCEDCKRRLQLNPLRVLDCKNERCREIVKSSFKDMKFICSDCSRHFDEALKYLDMLGIKYEIDPYIVRGLDYYTKTVFEVTHDGLGSQDAIGAGGRYDNLVGSMGGPDTGACGFALGMDRMMMILQKNTKEPAASRPVECFIATIGDVAYAKAFKLLDDLRRLGISCDIDYEKKSLKAQMRTADRLGARFALIIGEDEVARGEAVLRDMGTKEQTSVRFEELPEKMKEVLR
ncbi:MAG: histidine--tRNA ligase [Candidatus Omnitrophota bacterium]|jgi:histidyl-tRNA synthetase